MITRETITSKQRSKLKSIAATLSPMAQIGKGGITDNVLKTLSDGLDAHELIKVKTTNMGSMFRLTYNISLKNPKREKAMIDMLRTRNGNLDITVSVQDTTSATL